MNGFWREVAEALTAGAIWGLFCGLVTWVSTGGGVYAAAAMAVLNAAHLFVGSLWYYFRAGAGS